MQSNRMNWLIALSVMVLLGAAVVTLRAAEQNFKLSAPRLAAGGNSAPTGAPPPGSVKQHPPASAPEESATIKDDPTTAPDPSQSADNNVSFPTDI
jgi:hypothetical protein